MQNKYEVLGVVGEGAYGIVYKCKNKETKQFVAIKKFKETEDEIVKKTMRRELKMLQVLKHENVVEFIEAFKRKGNWFLVFEYVERNLLEVLQETPMGLGQAVIKKIIYQMCKSIQYWHEQNIIHRDIKPENWLINNRMVWKLCDFGFARKALWNTKEAMTDYVATRWYRSPEWWITGGIYGPEVDYWAIGCIMGEWADGNPMFPGDNETDQWHCIEKVLGNWPEAQIELFYKNPIYNGKTLWNVNKPETWEKRYLGKLSKVAISFLKGLLELDPKKRWNGKNVFAHPYFEGFEKNNSKEVASNNNNSRNKEKDIFNQSTNNINNIKVIKSNPTVLQTDTMLNTTNINIINYNTFIEGKTAIQPIPNSHAEGIGPIPPSKVKTKDIDKINSLNKPKAEMMTTGNFPSLSNVSNSTNNHLFPKQIKTLHKKKPATQQDLTSTSFIFSKQISGISHLPGYKTFYNKNDKYNFNINTNYTNNIKAYNKHSPNRDKGDGTIVIDEAAEYLNTNNEKKSKAHSLNPLMKTNTNIGHKLSMCYLGGNFGGGGTKLYPNNSRNGWSNINTSKGMKGHTGYGFTSSYYGTQFIKKKSSVNNLMLPALVKASNDNAYNYKKQSYHKYS